MAVSQEEIAFATDLFAGLGAITTRRMMGGLCLYCGGTIFAIVHSDYGIMLKAKGDFIAELEALGAEQWAYQREGQKPAKMPYWTLPASVQDDPGAATVLARRALAHL